MTLAYVKIRFLRSPQVAPAEMQRQMKAEGYQPNRLLKGTIFSAIARFPAYARQEKSSGLVRGVLAGVPPLGKALHPPF
jgi:hypothetical protein